MSAEPFLSRSKEIPMRVGKTLAACGLVMVSAMVLSSLAANADDKVNNVSTLPVPDGGQPVAARTDPEGVIHLLYNTAAGPRYARSTDQGITFGAAIPVVDKESQKPGLEFAGADMVAGKGGRIHVAMHTNAWKLKLPETEWAFFYATLERGAKAFTPVRNLNRKPSEGFSLAADDKGNVTACWLSDKLYANVSHDNGKTFAPWLEINPAYDPCNCCTSSAVFGADGKLAVLYREETNNDRDMYLVLWDQGRGQVTRTQVSSTLWKIDSCPMTYYSISRGQYGFVAVWPTKGQIYFARLDSKGQRLPPGEIKTPGKAGHRTGMLALNGPDGSTLIAWKKDDHEGWQLYDAKGQPVGSSGSASSPGNGIAGVVDKDGHFLLFR